MCVLSDGDILKELDEGNLIISPFRTDLLGPNSYDWTLGETIFEADPEHFNHWHPVGTLVEGDEFTFEPFKFYLAYTQQRFILPRYIMGEMTGRSGVGRLGVIEHFTAAHVDNGFPGHLTAEVMVLGPWPVPLKVGANIGQIIFHYLRTESLISYSERGASHYVDQPMSPVPSRFNVEAAWK